jgi:hypothetical protein
MILVKSIELEIIKTTLHKKIVLVVYFFLHKIYPNITQAVKSPVTLSRSSKYSEYSTIR